MRSVAEGVVARIPTAAERNRRLVGIDGKLVTLGIGHGDRTFDQKRTIGTHADSYVVGHRESFLRGNVRNEYVIVRV